MRGPGLRSGGRDAGEPGFCKRLNCFPGNEGKSSGPTAARVVYSFRTANVVFFLAAQPGHAAGNTFDRDAGGQGQGGPNHADAVEVAGEGNGRDGGIRTRDL